MTYAVVEGVAIPVPGVEELDAVAFGLGPLIAIRQWSVQSKDGDGEGHEDCRSAHANVWLVPKGEAADVDAVKGEVEDLAQRDDGEVQRREVVVEEELTLHQVEGKVVKGPT